MSQRYVHFWKFHSGRYIDDFVNKRKVETVQSDITLGRN